MINYLSKTGRIFLIFVLLLPIVNIYDDIYFLLAYMYTIFIFFIILNTKKININILTITFTILYLQSFFLPLYYYALIQKLDIWFEYLGLDLLSSDKLAYIMFLINTSLLGSVFISQIITPYENKLLQSIKMQAKYISFSKVNSIFNILILLMICSSIYSITMYFNLGTFMYNHNNIDAISRFLLLVISPSQLTVIFFIYYFIALINNYKFNKKVILMVLIISVTGMLIGTRSTLLIMIVTLIIIYHYAIKVNNSIYINYIKNRKKLIIYILLLIVILIVVFYIATVLRVYLYREHNYSSLLEMVSNNQYSSIKRIIA